jgi:DNA modification methylase
VGQIARHLGRNFIGIELNPLYIPLIEARIAKPWSPPKTKRLTKKKPAVNVRQKQMFST